MFHVEHCDLTYQQFTSYVDVSRETYDKLKIYHQILTKWQPKINLVSQKTLGNVWERHFLDSAQVFSLILNPDWITFDLGSGGGFPGLVLSIMGIKNIHLIESDQRKCSFLLEVIRQTGATAQVHNQRIEETVKTLGIADVITSRACAPLHQLLQWSEPLLKPDSKLLLLKGKSWMEELGEAQKDWQFEYEKRNSLIDTESVILEITQLKKRVP